MRPPNLTLHPPSLVTINLPSTLKAIPKLVSCALQGQSVCELRNYNILISKPTHPLATGNKKGDREHQAQGWVTLSSTQAPRPGPARERFIYAKIHETRNKTGLPGSGDRHSLPYLSLYLLLSSAVVLLVLVGSQNLLLNAQQDCLAAITPT